ncbi:MAG: carboxypeptidase M32, partial [Proteobacteria bacterium]|nr:carboxypeptidase M32 [Pseudomonadota bacterium]NDF55316.1 carboxypeptidase M32 [Pseudomonadota bacterium]
MHDLHAASAVLGWDQMTYLPAGAGGPRGRHLATLTRLAHEHFTDDRIGVLLDSLGPFESSLPSDSDEASLLRIARQDYRRAVRVPGSFMATFAEHQSASYQAWAVARPANDWEAVTPILERTVDLSREYAGFFPRTAHLADVFVDEAEPGLDVASVRELFSSLRARLVPMVRQIIAQPRPDDTFLTRAYPVDTQWQFGEMVARKLGYDFERGRQDRAPHPFTTSFSR